MQEIWTTSWMKDLVYLLLIFKQYFQGLNTMYNIKKCCKQMKTHRSELIQTCKPLEHSKMPVCQDALTYIEVIHTQYFENTQRFNVKLKARGIL